MEVNAANAVLVEAGKWYARASEVGLQPGQWPKVIPTTLGDGTPLSKWRTERDGNEIYAVVYRQESGAMMIRIYNDHQ